jgi:hypothetical protein
MMKKIILFPILICFATFISCQKTEVPDGTIKLNLNKYGKQFSIYVPDTLKEKLEIKEQSWGALEIKIGKRFYISITEDPGDIELLKSDIQTNDVNVFKSYIIDEPQTLMWESYMVKPEFHFYTIQKAAGNTYVFQDVVPDDGESFSKESIENMHQCSKQLIEK